MASEFGEFENYFENLKEAARKSFAVIYAGLKARELRTLRQLDAIRKQCESDTDTKEKLIGNIHISFDNESVLLENINSYGNVDLEKLNFSSETFPIEDYVCPSDDHMYSYKCIDDITKDDDMSMIEMSALEQVTKSDCVCYVNIRAEDVPHKFRENCRSLQETSNCDKSAVVDNVDSSIVENKKDILGFEESVLEENCLESLESDPDIKKIEPTDDWLNYIKDQTEVEPSQSSDIMEYSKIECL